MLHTLESHTEVIYVCVTSGQTMLRIALVCNTCGNYDDRNYMMCGNVRMMIRANGMIESCVNKPKENRTNCVTNFDM